MARQINRKVLIGLLVVALLLGGGGVGVYVWRSQRNATALLEDAKKAEEQGRHEDAAGLLAGYLAYRPKDNEQRARMGELLEKAGTVKTKLQAIGVYEKVLRLEPKREDIRRRLVTLAVGVEQFADARPHLAVLHEAKPVDAELEYLLGRCAESASEFTEAATWYEKARRKDPKLIDSHTHLANLLRRRLKDGDGADQVMEEMLAANESSVRACLALARYHKEHATLEVWEEDVARMRKLAPEEPDVLLAASELAQAKNELDRARTLLQQALAKAPRQAGLYAVLAGVELQGGRAKEAVEWLRKGIDQVDDANVLREALAEALLETGDLDAVGKVIEELRKRDHPQPSLDYLEARVLMGKAQWREAARLLEAVRGKVPSPSERAGRIERSLGLCHERLGNIEQALEAYQQAVADDPRGVASRFALASSLLAVGRTGEAISECRRLAATPHSPGGGLALLARGLIQQNLRSRADSRSWKEVDDILARAEKAEPLSAEVTVLRAESLTAQGQLDKARTLLAEARDKQPNEPTFWVALIALSDQKGKPEETLALIAKAQQKLGKRIELYLARVRYWGPRRDAEASAALTEIERELEKLPENQQPRLLSALAEARYLRGEDRDAERLWGKLVQRQPSDLRAHVQLFDVALRAENAEAMRRQVDALKKVEGDDGTFWRFGEATLLLMKARKGDKEALSQARNHLNDLQRRRPRWSRTALLAAGIDELRGDRHGAAENYQRAISQGDRQYSVVRRLVQLLTELQRYAEAEAALGKLKREQLAAGGLLRLAAEVSVHRQEGAQAIEMARQTVSADSKRYEDHLWLGQLLMQAGKLDDAEKSIRRAIDLEGQASGPWTALVECLLRNNQKNKAEAALKEAATKLTTEQASGALARCHEMLGQFDKAEEQYQVALRARPDDTGVLRSLATYYLRTNQPRKAEPHLRKMLEPRVKASEGEQTWARRSLAVLLAQMGGQRSFQEALALTTPEKGVNETANDERARALVLATRPGRRREAIRLLEVVRRRQPLPDDEMFLLAQLHERENEWASAQAVLDALADSQGNDPSYRAYYARNLLKHNKPEAARPHVEKLEKLDPQSPRTAELKARLLKATGRGEDAVALLREQAKAKDAPRLTLAALLEELGEGAAAEPLYRENADKSDRVDRKVVLGAYLGRQGRFDEALALFDEAWKTCPPETVALAALALLRSPKVEAKHFERVETALKAALDKASNPLTLLLYLATLRDLQGRWQDAEAVYRQVLAKESNHVLALNNLAWLLAHQKGKGKEALDLLDRALAAVGPLPDLLDTRAVVHLQQQASEAAIKDLEKVLEDYPTATNWYHMARAQSLKQDYRAAESALRKARAAGLKAETLHPLERPTYKPLLKELGLP